MEVLLGRRYRQVRNPGLALFVARLSLSSVEDTDSNDNNFLPFALLFAPLPKVAFHLLVLISLFVKFRRSLLASKINSLFVRLLSSIILN